MHGPAVDALAQVERVLCTELNAAAENPHRRAGRADDRLPADQADHPLDADIAAAEGLIAAWA